MLPLFKVAAKERKKPHFESLHFIFGGSFTGSEWLIKNMRNENSFEIMILSFRYGGMVCSGWCVWDIQAVVSDEI